MRKIQRNVTTAILLISFSLYCFSQGLVRQVTNFKKIKHTIDTLVIIPSYVDIKGIDVNNKLFSDTVFSPKLCDTVSFLISNLLKNKYHLKHVSGDKRINNIIKRDFNKLFNDINISGNSMPNIELPDSIFQTDINNSRYSLITIFVGLYRTSEKVRKDAKESLPASLAVGILSLGSLMLIPTNPSYLAMRIILYDRIEKRVLYYKTDYMPGFNRVDFYNINQFIMKNFKTIYYK